MSIEAFKYEEQSIRAMSIDGEPAFIASDLCDALDIRNSRDALSSLDDDEKGVVTTDTLGGPQQVAYVTESGMYSLVLRSRKPEAKAFKRWITHEVLPAIRKTGAYSTQPALTGPELMATALIEADRMLKAKDAQIAELEPAARAWHDITGANGSWSADESAQMLRGAGIMTGRNRLFKALDALGWTYFTSGERHVKQTAIEAGVLVLKAYPPRYKASGERLNLRPQIRITGKGLDRLAEKWHTIPMDEELAL